MRQLSVYLFPSLTIEATDVLFGIGFGEKLKQVSNMRSVVKGVGYIAFILSLALNYFSLCNFQRLNSRLLTYKT